MLQKSVVKARLGRKEFARRLKAVMLGVWVWKAVLERRGKRWQEAAKILEDMLEEGQKKGYDELVETARGNLVPAEWLDQQVGEVISDFEDDVFWERLETDLAHRDMENNHGDELAKMSDEKREDLHDRYHERWAGEFEKNGIERLGIVVDDNRRPVREKKVVN